MRDFFTFRILVATAVVAINFAVPYLFAALGETYGQRSGTFNLGVDGVMLIGAFTAYYAVLKGSSVWLGCLYAVLAGLVMGLVVAFVNVTMKAEQGISGIGIYLFGLGISDLVFEKRVGTPLPIQTFPTVRIPVLSELGRLGPLFQQHIFVFVALALVPLSGYVMRHTTFGLALHAVGENPEAADSVGIPVNRIRYYAQLINGAMSGLAGAVLAIYLQVFQQNLTAGLGFIAVALVYFGAWKPRGVLGGALLFGGVQAVVAQWKALGIIPSEWGDFAAMAPAVVTVLVLVLVARSARQPAALGRPFTRGG